MKLTSLNTALRFALVGLSMLALLAAMWAGLLRLGWRWPLLQATLALSHGPLMISAFLGTLIAVERAVALRQRWTYLGPVLSGVGGLLLILGAAGAIGPVLITLGSLGLVAVFGEIVRRHPSNDTVVMALGSLAWLVGNLLWLSGRPVFQFVLWWAGFLILTIAGERLELGRILRLSRAAELAFLASTALFLSGLVVSLPLYDLGVRLAGGGMLALAAWLLRFDIARRTVRKPGLPRYAAICLLGGYFWLALAGIEALLFGGVAAGPRYDALLHAIFLGYVFSMIFGHAPIIFPAVLERPIAFHPLLYVPLVLLHASLLLRVISDLAGALQVRLWAGLLNAIALLVFIGSMAYTLRKIQGTASP